MIAGHLATVALFPLGIAARRIGRPLPDPRRWFGEYIVRGPAGVFACPPIPSPCFLGVDTAFEPGLSRLIDSLEGGTFVDVGASIGFVAARAARRADLVIAVEPHPVQFVYLERNMRLNGLDNVTCINCAVGEEDGAISLYDVDPTLGPHPLHVSTRPGRGQVHTVPIRRLDSLVQDDVAMLKIDVEGDEVSVLRGAPRLLESRPQVVVESLGGKSLPQLRELLPGYSFDELDESNYLASP